MPFPSLDRKKYLDSIKADPSKKRGSIQIHYKDDPRYMVDVYEVELKYLIFNQYNDRIAIEVETEEAMSPGGTFSDYTAELEKKIMDYLWGINTPRNQETLEDLELRGQIEPGVVTADGVIVNGNRRAMLLKRSNKGIFKAAILPDEFNGNVEWIRKLETELQFNVDKQLEYEPLAKYLKVKHLKEMGIDISEIAKMMRATEGKVEKWLGTMQVMDDYLEYIGADGVYTLLRFTDSNSSKEEAFLQTYSQLTKIRNQKAVVNWPYDPVKDARKYQQMMFDLIRSECINSPQDYRLLGIKGGADGEGVFSDGELFQAMYDKHKKIVDQPTKELPTLNEYRQLPDCQNIKDSVVELSKYRENDWIGGVSIQLKNNFKEFTGKRQARVDKLEPSQRLDQALTELKCISDEDMNDPDFIGNEVSQNQAREISRIVERIKRNMGL
jgi:hypothetical protein